MSRKFTAVLYDDFHGMPTVTVHGDIATGSSVTLGDIMFVLSLEFGQYLKPGFRIANKAWDMDTCIRHREKIEVTRMPTYRVQRELFNEYLVEHGKNRLDRIAYTYVHNHRRVFSPGKGGVTEGLAQDLKGLVLWLKRADKLCFINEELLNQLDLTRPIIVMQPETEPEPAPSSPAPPVRDFRRFFEQPDLTEEELKETCSLCEWQLQGGPPSQIKERFEGSATGFARVRSRSCAGRKPHDFHAECAYFALQTSRHGTDDEGNDVFKCPCCGIKLDGVLDGVANLTLSE